MSKELDGFDDYRNFIKSFIIQNSNLWKIIYYPVFSPLKEEDLENPYEIFEDSSAITEKGNEVHGVVLFKQKNNTILNSSLPVILINFRSSTKGSLKEYNNIYIVIKIICKGEYIQDIEYEDDVCSRSNVIAKLFDNNLNKANINGLGEVKRISFDNLSINEENTCLLLTYRLTSFSCDLSSNINFQENVFGGESDELR